MVNQLYNKETIKRHAPYWCWNWWLKIILYLEECKLLSLIPRNWSGVLHRLLYFIFLCASDRKGQRHHIFWLSVHVSVQCCEYNISRMNWKSLFLQKHTLGPEGEFLEVKVQTVSVQWTKPFKKKTYTFTNDMSIKFSRSLIFDLKHLRMRNILNV